MAHRGEEDARTKEFLKEQKDKVRKIYSGSLRHVNCGGDVTPLV